MSSLRGISRGDVRCGTVKYVPPFCKTESIRGHRYVEFIAGLRLQGYCPHCAGAVDVVIKDNKIVLE